MAGQVQHLFHHSSGYLWRRRLPEPLARLMGRTHIKRSLATRDRRIAIRRAREASARIERLRAEVEQAMSEGRLPTREELTAVLAAFFRDLLEVGERRRDRTQGGPDWQRFRWVTEDLAEDQNPLTVAEQMGLEPPEMEDDPDGRLFLAEQDAFENRREAVERRLDLMLARAGVSLPKDHPAYARLCRLALIVRVEAAKIDAARDYGDYSAGWPQAPSSVPPEAVPDPARDAGVAVPTLSPTPPAEATPQAPRAARRALATPLLSEAWAEFCAAKQRDGEWRDHKTALDAQRTLRLWLDLMGDTRTGEIDRRMALTFRTMLRDLPARNGKSVYAGLSPSAAIALAKDITAQLDRGERVIRLGTRTLRAAEAAAVAEPISFKSCNKVLTFLTAFGSWAEQNERRDWFGPGGNPFTRLLYRKQTVRAHRDSDKARRAMPDEVLRLLFSSPVWAGRDPDADIYEGTYRPRDAKFWLPLIALFSGMRLSEIAQLRLADIRTEQGVAFFAVLNTAETSVKTPSSERFVPIHRELIRLGLMDRVAELTQRGERRLFPEIVARATQGDDYGASFSRWFSRYRYGLAERTDAAGKRFQPLGRKGYDFHALRHTFITRARETRAMTDAQLDRITGHKGQAMRDTYTGDLSLAGLADAVNAVRFDLDLSHLLPTK
jgi:integrase